MIIYQIIGKYFQIQFVLCILSVTNKSVFFFKYPSITSPTRKGGLVDMVVFIFIKLMLTRQQHCHVLDNSMEDIGDFFLPFFCREKRKESSFQAARGRLIIYDCPEGNLYVLSRPLAFGRTKYPGYKTLQLLNWHPYSSSGRSRQTGF